MKKFFMILGGIILFLLLSMFLVPILFKGKIVSIIKAEANKTINAELDFDNDIDLSLFSNFPDITLNVNDLIVINKDPFEGDTLVQMHEFQATVDIMSVISGDEIELLGIHLIEPRFHAHILEDGRANWDIMIEDTTASGSETNDTTAGEMKMSLRNYSIRDAHLRYDDESLQMFAVARNLDHEGKGDFTQDLFQLNTKTHIEALTVEFEDIAYLSEVETQLDAIFEVNLPESKYTFQDNLLRLNQFTAGFDGFIAMPEDDINMDLTFEAQETEFRNILSLIPAVYTADFNELKSSGQLSFNGSVNGTYTEESLPAFQVDLEIKNGQFQYPDLPTGVNDVQVDLKINNPGGDADNTVINLRRMHFEMAGEPFDAKMLVKTPVSDPYINSNIKGRIDLDQVENLLLLEEEMEIGGMLNADLSLEGNLSSVEQERYEEFNATGSIDLKNFVYNTPDLPQKIGISSSHMDFSPEFVDLTELSMTIGESDLHGNGELRNMLPYFMNDGVLAGKLSIASDHFNLNPFMVSEEGEAREPEPDAPGRPEETVEEGVEAIEVPANIDFVMDAQFRELIYDNLDLKNVVGKVIIRDQVVNLQDLQMNLLNGTLAANGTYSHKTGSQPEMDFGLQVRGFNIRKTYDAFVSVQKLAPIAKHIEGDFDASIQLNSDLTRQLMPVWESMFGKGKLDIDRMTINNFTVLNKVAETLNKDEYKRILMTDIKPSFKIEGGRFFLQDPINFKVDDADVAVSGSHGIDQTMDYIMAVELPAAELKQQASGLASNLLGQDVDLPMGETVIVNLSITGTIDNPVVRPSFGGTGKSLMETVKDQVKQEMEERKKELEEEARKKLEQQKKEAQQRMEEEAEKRRKELERKKKEAEEKARKEMEKKKKEAEDETKEKIKDIFR